MKRLWMAGMLVTAAALALPAASRAADWHVAVGVGFDYGYGPDYRQGGPAFRYGYDRGWREGSDEGRHDGRKHRDPRYWREGEYRHGDKGYKRWMGAKWEYVAGFRRGYEAGYRRAYAAFHPGWRDGRGYDDRHRRDDDWR
jgi:hypothetical protein